MGAAPRVEAVNTIDGSTVLCEHARMLDGKERRIVIVGGGFAGLAAARALGRAKARITLVDRSNHHVFQPLLYQVATAGLSPADIAMPIRSVLRGQANTEVLLAEVTGIDLANRRVRLSDREDGLPYDFLVLATGARHGYFGKDEWEEFAPGLKSIRDATAIRRRILLAFEAAEKESDPARCEELLTFVIVGGGPTGVELAGAISELARKALARDFRHIDPTQTRVLLLEAGPRLLSGFPVELAEQATLELERLGVTVLTDSLVQRIDAGGVHLTDRRIPSGCVIWAAGVVASRAGAWLGAETDRAGRVKVNPDLSVPGQPRVFVVGDTASLAQDGTPLPGLAPVAMQQGRYVASHILKLLNGEPSSAFRYRDKGNLATVGRKFAIVEIKGLRFGGFVAWLIWLVVHIFYLIGFRNRLVVMIEWAWAYATFQRGARLITN